MPASLSAQWHRNAFFIAVLYLPAILLLVATVLANRLAGIPVFHLTQDPSLLGGIPPWAGAISSIGVLFWCAAMTLCFAGAVVLHRRACEPEMGAFLCSCGALTALLMLDDLFMLHESSRDQLGIPEQLFFAIYLVWAAACLIRYRDLVRRTDFLLLLVGCALLGASMTLDNVQSLIVALLPQSAYFLLEDGLKLLGIVGWFGYFARLFERTLPGPRQAYEGLAPGGG